MLSLIFLFKLLINFPFFTSFLFDREIINLRKSDQIDPAYLAFGKITQLLIQSDVLEHLGHAENFIEDSLNTAQNILGDEILTDKSLQKIQQNYDHFLEKKFQLLEPDQDDLIRSILFCRLFLFLFSHDLAKKYYLQKQYEKDSFRFFINALKTHLGFLIYPTAADVLEETIKGMLDLLLSFVSVAQGAHFCPLITEYNK